MINLDTHIVLFALTGDLRKKERAILEKSDWGISAIVIWELTKLNQRGRIQLDFNDPDFRDLFNLLHVWPIDFEVSMQSCSLDFNSDPANELIAATSIVHYAPLLTRDTRISDSKRVPFAH
jgi:PIN domain nuclease of toxin-antitoxin system